MRKLLCFFGFHRPWKDALIVWHPIGIFGMPPYERSYICEVCGKPITERRDELPFERLDS